MIDVPKQIEYWKTSAKEDWDAAMDLISKQRSRHGLFFIHLALEKTLKALVTKSTGNVPPKIHALLRLGDLAGLSLTDEHRDFLGEFDRYQIEGRYPEFAEVSPDAAEVEEALSLAREMMEWLKGQL